MTKEQLARLCVEYILDTENEDFEENPSREHVLYFALAYKFGEEYAERELQDTISFNLSGEGKL